jgi:hypothetical protein
MEFPKSWAMLVMLFVSVLAMGLILFAYLQGGISSAVPQ